MLKKIFPLLISLIIMLSVTVFAIDKDNTVNSDRSEEHICNCEAGPEHGNCNHEETCTECEEEDHNDTDKEDDEHICSECSSDHEHSHEHNDTGEMPSLSGLDVEEEQNSDQGCQQNHDPFLMDSITEQPWRHPEKVGNELWLKRIAPISALFILAILLRPVLNNLIRRAGK